MSAILDRRIAAFRPDLAAAHLRGQVEAARFAEPLAMSVVAGVAPLRREPRPDAALDTQALAGEAVAVYERHEGWAWVQLQADGYVGYLPDDELRAEAPAPTHRVTVPRSFIYPGPSMKLPPLEALPLGASIAVAGTEGKFLVLAEGGRFAGGHVFAGHLAPLSEQAEDFVAVAEMFLHAPYLWGGKTGLGLDCSGLVQIALAAAGIEAPRDSDMQARDLGTAVACDDDLAGLIRGDLVFWKGHVGIMADAEMLLHANGHMMLVTREPLRQARDRTLENGGGAITGIRRLG